MLDASAAVQGNVFNPSAAIVEAIKATYAYIEFEPDGTIIGANKHFLAAMGYTNEEIAGRHHRIFMPPNEIDTQEYRDFWAAIGRGEAMRGTFKRIRKDGEPIWISATYSPIYDKEGRIRRAFKTAIDLTEEVKLRDALAAALKQLAEGDLSASIAGTFTGEKKATQNAFNDTARSLREIFGGVMQHSAALESLAQGINSRADEVNSGAGALTAAIQGSITAVGSMTGAITKAADHAQDGENLAREAAQRSEQGRVTVEGAIRSIQAIAGITSEISKITKVIDGFAFQTNLLSINAAVEAARAGEAGRGFAVVATEVRELANRSSTASREIAELISRGESEVASGVTQVQQAGASLSGINEAVGRMVESTSAIARFLIAQKQEASGLQGALDTMSQQTGQLNAMSQSNREAARSMTREDEDLNETVSRFRF